MERACQFTTYSNHLTLVYASELSGYVEFINFPTIRVEDKYYMKMKW